MTKLKNPSAAFDHALRGAVHAIMAATALDKIDLPGRVYPKREREWIERAVDMINLWSMETKHFDTRYVWLPSNGVLPDDEPALGVDYYRPPIERQRRKGGIKGRLARLEREFDGHKLH